MKAAAALALALTLAACGQVAPLRPQSGQSLPPKPEAARSAPDAERLMTPNTQSRPARNDELLENSEKRQPDRFDLPPPG